MNNHFDTATNLNTSTSKSDLMNNQKSSNTSSEFKNFVTDIEDLIAQTTSLTGPELAKAKEQLNQRIGQAKQAMDKLGTSIVHRARKGAEMTNTYVHEQPWIAVGAGAALGLILGFVLSRSQTKKAS